jgi:hypothetical protein
MLSKIFKKKIDVPSWTELLDLLDHELKRKIKENNNSIDSHIYQEIRSSIKSKINIPTWNEFFGRAEFGCEDRIEETKKGSQQRTSYLVGRLSLISSVKEKGLIDSSEYHDIKPFVELGYTIESEKKKKYLHKK